MSSSLPQRQRGAALVIGLLLLMILTVLGVSGMTTSALELAMADNMQRGQYTFQAAETALNTEMALANNIGISGNEVRNQDLGGSEYEFKDEAGTVVADVGVRTTYQGIVTFGEGARQVHFESRGIATSPTRGARSTQRQGYFVLAPRTRR